MLLLLFEEKRKEKKEEEENNNVSRSGPLGAILLSDATLRTAAPLFTLTTDRLFFRPYGRFMFSVSFSSTQHESRLFFLFSSCFSTSTSLFLGVHSIPPFANWLARRFGEEQQEQV